MHDLTAFGSHERAVPFVKYEESIDLIAAITVRVRIEKARNLLARKE